MKSLHSSATRTVIALGVIALAVGCNSILDNEEGTLRSSATPTDVEENQPAEKDTPNDGTSSSSTTSSSTSSSSTSGAVTTPAPTPPDTTGKCKDGTHICGGICVGNDDPAYGCGGNDCKPCSVAHGTAACAAGACAVKACDRGYSDCNAKSADGCEVDLSKAGSCGSCNAVCPPASPVCAPKTDTFECGTGCTPAAPLLCGNECVDPMTSVNHCGTCSTACPAVPDGEATCAIGKCGFTCHPTFHACGTKCAAANDATACGAACTVCPAAANAVATCVTDACSFTCTANYGDCNLKPEDGCEAAFLTDPLNCGGCGKSCNGGTCTNGACSAAPEPDAGTAP